jgi:hypothetical protein
MAFLMGCGPTANQLKMAQAYYQSVQGKAQNPLVEIKVADPTKPANIESIKVWGPDQGIQQYAERDYAAPWIGLTQSVMSIAVPWIGAWAIVDSVGKVAGHNATNYSVTGTNNRVAGPTQIQANIVGNSNTLGGSVEQSIPTTTTTTTNTTTTTTPTTTTNTTGTTQTGDVNLTP